MAFNPAEAAEIVNLVFLRVLEKEADGEALIFWGTELVKGTRTVRETVRLVGKSKEYGNKYVVPYSPLQAAKLMYKHFLAKGDYDVEEDLKGLAGRIAGEGWLVGVDFIVDSPEYSQKFGDNSVPA